MQIVQVVRARARQTCLYRGPGCDTFALRAGKRLAGIVQNYMGRRSCISSLSLVSFVQIKRGVWARARQTCLYREPGCDTFALRAGKLLAGIIQNCMGRRSFMYSIS